MYPTERSPQMNHSDWRHIQFFPAPLIYTSLCLPLWLALREGHMHCLWPLPHLLLVCTTVLHVLFLATPL